MELNTAGSPALIEGMKGGGFTSSVLVLSMILATLVVICAKRPSTRQEWVIGIISTLMSSLGGGSAFLLHMDLMHWMNSYIGLMAVGGIFFACGLPGWALVRLLFNTIERNKGKTITDVVKDVKEVL